MDDETGGTADGRRRALIDSMVSAVLASYNSMSPPVPALDARIAQQARTSVDFALAVSGMYKHPMTNSDLEDASGADLGASAALALHSLVRDEVGCGPEVIADAALWSSAFAVGLGAAARKNGFVPDPQLQLGPREHAFRVFEAYSARQSSLQTTHDELRVVFDEAASVKPLTAAASPWWVRFADWVTNLLGSTAGTYIRIVVALLAVVGVAGVVISEVRSNEDPPVIVRYETPPTAGNEVLPDLAGNSAFEVISSVYRTSPDDTHKAVSGLEPGDPLVVQPGETFYVSVIMQKKVASAPLPSNLAYAVQTSTDTLPVPGSFRLYNQSNKDGVAIPDMTTEYTPIMFDNGGAGVSITFAATAPTDVPCGYNLRRMASFFTAGTEWQIAAPTVYVAKPC